MPYQKIRNLVMLASASAALGGCTGLYGDGLYTGASVGTGYYDDGYYGNGYSGYNNYANVGDPYWGWYGDYYYPGSGAFVYDQYRRPYRWNRAQQRYWAQRRQGWRGQYRNDGNWGDFDRNGRNDRRDRRDRDYRGDGRRYDDRNDNRRPRYRDQRDGRGDDRPRNRRRDDRAGGRAAVNGRVQTDVATARAQAVAQRRAAVQARRDAANAPRRSEANRSPAAVERRAQRAATRAERVRARGEANRRGRLERTQPQ